MVSSFQVLPDFPDGPLSRFLIHCWLVGRRRTGRNSGPSNFLEPEVNFFFDFVVDLDEDVIIKRVEAEELAYPSDWVHIEHLSVGEHMS